MEDTEGTASSEDPLSLTIVDPVTGQVIAQQALYHELWTTTGEASVEWNDIDGLTLKTGTGGHAAISMETLSDWILNPFVGSASLVDGVFNTSGNLGLAWRISTVGGITTATLPRMYLDPAMRFEIQATGLGQPTNGIELVFSSSLGGSADAQQVVPEVPEPASLVLCGTGMLTLLGRSRRRRRRLLGERIRLGAR